MIRFYFVAAIFFSCVFLGNSCKYCVYEDQCLRPPQDRNGDGQCFYPKICCESIIESTNKQSEPWPNPHIFKPPSAVVPITYWPLDPPVITVPPPLVVPLNALSGSDDISKHHNYPWIVALFNDGNYFAGGSLIKPGVVLTVAHWLVDKNETDLTVRADEWDLSSEVEGFEVQERQVQRMLLHDKFNYQTGANNLALLYLRDSFELSDHIRTIRLPNPNTSFQGRRCTVAGWGKIRFNDQEHSSTLKKVDLIIIDNHRCEQQLRLTRLGKYFRVPENAICAGGELNQDACVGDGGSPLFCPVGDESPGQYVQAGIVNWGVGCGEKDVPAMYTEVSKFYKWIQENSSGFTFRSTVKMNL